jgi:hypothetical protein
MARLQVSGLIHTRDAATLLPEQHVGPENALPTTPADDLISKRRARESAIRSWSTTRNAPTVASVRDSQPRRVYSRSRSSTSSRSGPRGR